MSALSAPPALLALDLDGTLIDGATLRMGVATIDAVRAAMRAGVQATIVTGRMFAAALPFARELAIAGTIVCYQGAAIYDIESGERLRHVPLAHDVAIRVVRAAQADGFHVQLYEHDRFFVQRPLSRYGELYAHVSGVPPIVVDSLEERFAGRDSTKVVIVADPPLAAQYIPRVEAVVGDDAYVTRSQPEFIEILDPRVDKGEALRFVAERLGIPLARTLAIGDSWNDLPLLRAAGFGVAMASAPPELCATADAVVADAAHDGVAEAIRRFVLDAGEPSSALL
jgi:Cof subfamily protein (haloacid dehalogenase superfamily)